VNYQEPERKRKPFAPVVGEFGELPLWEKVKQTITVEDLVSQFVDLNAKGIGKCPFHEDDNPSFSVNVNENYWNCFSGCGGGSVIDFWMKLNNVDFKEASQDLAERLGIK
jgi:DNA primase